MSDASTSVHLPYEGGRKIVHYTEEMDTTQAKGENELAPDLRQTEFSFFAWHEEYITGRLRTG